MFAWTTSSSAVLCELDRRREFDALLFPGCIRLLRSALPRGRLRVQEVILVEWIVVGGVKTVRCSVLLSTR